MRIFRTIAIAFSLYSRIPMPVFTWRDEDMKHNIVFLPWIGAVIGLFVWGASYLLAYFDAPLLTCIAVYAAIPLLLTGGFHVDGFMDVQDALQSYKSKEEKLAILKDPHIGAFAVIRLLLVSIVWAGALAMVASGRESSLWEYCAGFFLARSLSGIGSLKLTHAKKDGMLNMETDKASKQDVIALAIQTFVCMGVMICFQPLAGMLAILASILFFVYYRHLMYKQFGGVTGDTCGYYVVMNELVILVVLAVFGGFYAG